MSTSIFPVAIVCTVLLMSYMPETHSNIVKKDNQFYKQTYNKIEVINKLPNSNQEALKLLPCFTYIATDKEYIEPLDIYGISEDIIFNYNSDLKASSKYVNAMINNDWEVKSLMSDSKKITIELYKNNQTCKIVIEENKLKVYLKQLSNK